MVKTKRRYRVIACTLALLALLIFCGTPFQQAANAVAIVDDAIIAIVIAALAAMGITFTMTGGYQTVRDWIRDKITESGIDFSGVKYGASSVGSLLLNNVFVRRIAALATYIKAELGLLDNSTVNIIEPSVTIENIVLYKLPVYLTVPTYGTGSPYEYEYELLTSSIPTYAAVAISGESKAFYFISESNSAVVTKYTVRDGEIKSTKDISIDRAAGNYFYRYDIFYANSSWDNSGYEYSYPLNDITNALKGTISTGDNMLNATAGTISIPDSTDIDGMGGVLNLPVPWGQSMSGTLTDIPTLVLEGELDGNTTLDLESEGAVEDQVSDTATAEQPYVSSSASDYQSPGLSSVFPFCIPFDLYEFFECLAADPEAPEISWRFYVPGICDEQIEIDLSQFDTVAQIVRTMELLAFIVGLALVTREKFLRG